MDATCAICLEPLHKKDEKCFKIISCEHAFHGACIKNWFGSSSVSCPMCRNFVGIATKKAFLSIPGKTSKQLMWLKYSCKTKQLTICEKSLQKRKRKINEKNIKTIHCDKNIISFVLRNDLTLIMAVYDTEEQAKQNFKNLTQTFAK